MINYSELEKLNNMVSTLVSPHVEVRQDKGDKFMYLRAYGKICILPEFVSNDAMLKEARKLVELRWMLVSEACVNLIGAQVYLDRAISFVCASINKHGLIAEDGSVCPIDRCWIERKQ